MTKQTKRGPIWALILILILISSFSCLKFAGLQANTIVQPPGASCILNQTTSFKPLFRPPTATTIKSNTNSSIQMTNLAASAATQQQTRQTSESSSSSSSSWQQQQQQRQKQSGGADSQVAFETICNGWENGISSRASWLFDKSRLALIAKFLVQDRSQFFLDPELEAKLTSPLMPPIPFNHSMENSENHEKCRLSFRLYSTIASQIDVHYAPIQTVVAGSAHLINSPSASSLNSPIFNSIIDNRIAKENRIKADKDGESGVWSYHEILMPKSEITGDSNQSIPSPVPYKIEFSAVPTRVTSAEFQPTSDYLVGIALANITLSPECFGETALDITNFYTHHDELHEDRKLPINLIDHLDTFISEHKTILLIIVIALSASCLLYCTLNIGSLIRKPKNRRRVYAAQINNHCQREEQIIQKHSLHPIDVSLIENVELRDNPNYASLAHDNNCSNNNINQQTIYDHHHNRRRQISNVIDHDDDNDDDDYVVRYEPDEWEVDPKRLILGEQIGTGAFGMVYLGQLLSDDGTNKRVAIKTLPISVTLKQRMDFLREASIMKQFNTFYVVKLMGMVSTTNPVYVIMEYMENGDLKSYLRKLRETHQRQGKTLVDGIYLMAGQIADGMAYLSSKKFVHRDLAARNCMVNEIGVVKVGDFGLTRDIYDNEYYRRGTHGCLPVRWMAPESLLDNIYTSATDIWSYGIVVWEIVTFGAYPYQGLSNDEVVQRVCAGFNMSRPDNCPNKLYTIMQRCWLREQNERPTFYDIIEELLPETEGKLYPNCFYRSRSTMMKMMDGQQQQQQYSHYHQQQQQPLLSLLEPDNSSRAESYPMISDDRKPLVALYPVVH